MTDQALQPTRDELADAAQENYELNVKEAGLKSVYSSNIPRAIEAWRKEDQLRAQVEVFRHRSWRRAVENAYLVGALSRIEGIDLNQLLDDMEKHVEAALVMSRR